MILITGATGFLGSYIIKRLVEEGKQVKAIYRTRKLPFYISGMIEKNIEWVKGDVLDKGSLSLAMKKVDSIIHAAGIVSFIPEDRRKMYEVNVKGTANMVNEALTKRIKQFVHVSSISAIGISSSGASLNEENKWKDSKLHSHYAITKMEAENKVREGMEQGMNGIIINPTTVLGYGDWNESSCELFKNVYNGFKWYSNGVNGFVDVDDVARATLGLMDSRISGERFIINSENWSFKQLMYEMAYAFDISPPKRKATTAMLAVAWRLERLRSFFTRGKPLITREIAEAAETKSFFDNKKLLSALPGFSFTPVKESIMLACKKYMTHYKDK